MRFVYLLRHAKSSWKTGLPDHERPLAPRGRRAAKAIASYRREQGIEPELVLCSTARRARETLEPLRRALGEPRVVTEARVYGASEDELLVLLRELAPEVGSAMVVGHNPGLALLVELLAAPGTELPEKVPTGALAELAFDGFFADLAPGSATLEAFVVPRELDGD